MTINLDNITFYNDFYSVDLPDGSILFLNNVDESLLVNDVEVHIKAVNLVIVTTEGEQITCPNVIGMSNDYISINTKYTDPKYKCLGYVLTQDNMQYCTIEVADD